MRVGAACRCGLTAIFFLALMLPMGGCGAPGADPATSRNTDWFAPTAMRIHPIFTEIRNWTKGNKLDGIDAQLEFTDQFNDPTKASGQVLFELFSYNNDDPDDRGRRLAYWIGSLSTLDEQRARWNPTLRTYRFQLVYPQITLDQGFVLTATFERSGGGRFPMSSIVLPAAITDDKTRKTPSLNPLDQERNAPVGPIQPTSEPATRPTTAPDSF